MSDDAAPLVRVESRTLRSALSRLRVSAPDSFITKVFDAVGICYDRYVEVGGPAGRLLVAFNTQGISWVMRPGEVDADRVEFETAFRARHGREVRPSEQGPPSLIVALRSGTADHLTFDLRD